MMKRACLFLFIVFGIFGRNYSQQNSQILRPLTAQQPSFPVPNVYGLLPDSAFRIINASGFTNGTITEIQSDQPKGTVIRQAPGAGSQAFRGSPVNLYISLGPPTIDVPSLKGLTIPEARKILAASSLIPGQINQQNSASDEGKIIAQNPLPGTAVVIGSAVDLTVAIREPPQLILVPDVHGLPLDKARMILEKSGFPIADIYSVKSELDNGLVTSQKPLGGEMVDLGTSVILGVSVRESLPVWPWEVGFAILVLLGGLLTWKYVRNRKNKNLSKHGKSEITLKVIPDPGKQSIRIEEMGNDASGIQFKIIPDKGIQTFKINGNGLQ